MDLSTTMAKMIRRRRPPPPPPPPPPPQFVTHAGCWVLRWKAYRHPFVRVLL